MSRCIAALAAICLFTSLASCKSYLRGNFPDAQGESGVSDGAILDGALDANADAAPDAAPRDQAALHDQAIADIAVDQGQPDAAPRDQAIADTAVDQRQPDAAPRDQAIADIAVDQGQADAYVCQGIPCGCQLDGKNLWGNVFYVQFSNQADFLVYEEQFAANAALSYWEAGFSAQANSCGKWYDVNFSNQADIRLYKVQFSNQADFTIYKVDFPAQAGQTCAQCP